MQSFAFAPACRAANHDVEMRDNEFLPRNITIAVGDTITWHSRSNNDNTHTATADDADDPNAFDTGDVEPGDTSSAVRFDTAGVVRYHCEHHSTMTGTITVTSRMRARRTTADPRRGQSASYGANGPNQFRESVGKVQRASTPNLNDIYYSEYGRHYLGRNGSGFIIANDFEQTHIASCLSYAGETSDWWIYDISGIPGAQHAYDKRATAGQYGVWFGFGGSFNFWYYSNKERNQLPPQEPCN